MEVVYVDASECPRRVKGPLSSAISQVLWIYAGAAILVTPAAIVASNMSAATPVWVQIALFAAFAGALLLPFVALSLQGRVLKSSSLRIEPYGVTLRQILRTLARFRRDLDRSSGWSRTRIVVLATLVRLAAGASLVASLTYMLRNTPINNWTGLAGLSGLTLSALLWVAGGRLLRPRQTGAVLLARTGLSRAAGVMLFLTVAVAFVILFKLASDYWRDNPPWFVVVAIWIVGGVSGVMAYDKMSAMWTRANAEIHPRSADVRRWDKRRPALFLRSFPDDAQDVAHEMTNKWDEVAAVSLEDALHERVGRYAPYVAVAEPGRGLTSGAARDRFSGEEWRAAVQGWMDEALLITMVAGWTKGVQWELDQVVARGHVDKLLVVLPGGAQGDARWQHVCRSFSGTAWHAALLSVDPRFALAIHFSKGRVVVIASRAKSAGHYAAAIELAMYGMFCGKQMPA